MTDDHTGAGENGLRELFARERFDTVSAAGYLTCMWGLKTAPKTMQNWRSEGRGPHYIRGLNNRVVYERAALDAFGEAQLRGGTVSSTTEEKTRGAILPPGGPAARAMRGEPA